MLGRVRRETGYLQALGVVVIQQKWLDMLHDVGIAPLRVQGRHTSCHKAADCRLMQLMLVSLLHQFGDLAHQVWISGLSLFAISFNLYSYLRPHRR